jgi:hypothetical protein
MSTFTAIGPALDLDGPLPVAPEYRLLSVPGVVQGVAGRELNGVNVWGYPEDTPSLWEPCSAGTYRDKSEDSTWQQPRFDGLVAYLPIMCSTITAAPEEFAQRAEVTLNAVLSFGVEQALAQGVVGSTNPFFGDTNLTQLGGGAVSAQAGLNYLENAIGQTGRGGMIHATPGTVSAWNFVNLLTEGEVLRTANGTPVVSGGGYINTDPSGLTGSDPSVGQEWAFATGPVRVFLADGPSLEVSEYVDRSDNTVIYRAERYFLAEWDTSLQSGVLIDWTP